MNDSRIHRNIKIAKDDSAVKLGCRDLCGLPFNASERISEQSSKYFFIRRAADEISEACFTAL